MGSTQVQLRTLAVACYLVKYLKPQCYFLIGNWYGKDRGYSLSIFDKEKYRK